MLQVTPKLTSHIHPENKNAAWENGYYRYIISHCAEKFKHGKVDATVKNKTFGKLLEQNKSPVPSIQPS
ncbi:unnamed protein product [Trichobilharzia szidati]|nr:unnamed protein product [Trichobilharzia szidati]